jgi:competence protein ComEC
MGETGQPSGAGVRLACAALAWVGGVALQLQQPELWAGAAYFAIALAGIACAVAALRWRWWCVCAALLLLGFAHAGGQAIWRLQDALDGELDGRDLQVVGVVASLPQSGAAGVRFRFEIERAEWRGTAVKVPRFIALGWYRPWHEDGSTLGPMNDLRAGDRWRFGVRLRRPHGHVNPHGFDYELWLFEQGVRATGYVRASSELPPQRIADAAAHPIERLRQRVRDSIYAQVSDARAAGVLAALAVGDQSAIDREDWELLRNTGVAHLMSVSGLHVTMFGWLAGLAFGWLWRRSGRLPIVLPAPQAARIAGVLAAAAYALFSGWGVPAQRTVWMLGTAALLLASGRRWPWLLILLAAAVVVSALDPWALLQAGFWLSFVAVGLLMVSDAQREPAVAPSSAAQARWRQLLPAAVANARRGVRTQVIATLGLAPLTLVFFQQVSVVGFVANLIAIPTVTLLITPLALLGSVAAPLWSVGGWLTQQLASGLSLLAQSPGAVWTAAAAPAWAQATGLLAGVIAVSPLPLRLRMLALPLALPLLWPNMTRPEFGRFDVLAADVGQGTAVLVRTHQHTLVYDAGPQYSRGSDAGQRVLLPLLRARGERQIDRLVLSHRDTDHVGGAPALLRALPVGAVWSSLDAEHPLLGMATVQHRCEAGQSWTWDGVQFELLHPPAADYARSTKANARSCVLRISDGRTSALLTGDIEREQEESLVTEYGDALRSDLLLVPHHGSRTSSTAAFLDAVQPRVAVVQAGYRNRFGHPAPDVLERYQQRGIRVVTSAACGAFASGEPPSCERARSRRYWRNVVRDLADDPEPSMVWNLLPWVKEAR